MVGLGCYNSKRKREKDMSDKLEELRIPADDPAQWEEYERRKKQEEQDKNPDHREGGVVVIDL